MRTDGPKGLHSELTGRSRYKFFTLFERRFVTNVLLYRLCACQ